MAAFDLLAEHERDAAGAVIGPRAIIPNAAPELREHQQDDVVGVLVLAQVLHEGVDTLGHGGPQIAVSGILPGMRVKGAVVAVEDPGAQIGEMHLGDALQLPRDRGIRILHRRGVLLRGDLEDVFALQRIQAGLAHVVHHEAAADRRLVHLREAAEHLLALLSLDGRQEAVPLQRAGHARHRNALHHERARQARPHADGGDDVLLFGVEFARDPAEPTLGADLDRLAGVPDVHGPEMRARRILEADAVQDGELLVIPELLQGCHVVRDPVVLVQMHDLVVGDPHRFPVIAV